MFLTHLHLSVLQLHAQIFLFHHSWYSLLLPLEHLFINIRWTRRRKTSLNKKVKRLGFFFSLLRQTFGIWSLSCIPLPKKYLFKQLPFLPTSMLFAHLYTSPQASLVAKESACQCRKHEFDPWIGKIPWKRKWQPIPVFLPGKSHGQRSLVGYSPWGRKESDTTERLHL